MNGWDILRLVLLTVSVIVLFLCIVRNVQETFVDGVSDLEVQRILNDTVKQREGNGIDFGKMNGMPPGGQEISNVPKILASDVGGRPTQPIENSGTLSFPSASVAGGSAAGASGGGSFYIDPELLPGKTMDNGYPIDGSGPVNGYNPFIQTYGLDDSIGTPAEFIPNPMDQVDYTQFNPTRVPSNLQELCAMKDQELMYEMEKGGSGSQAHVGFSF